MKKAHILTLVIALLSLAVFSTTAAAAEDILPLPGIGTVNVESMSAVSFDTPQAWEDYASPSGAELHVENGVYRAYTPTTGYLWGLNDQEHTNVVAQVEVTPLTIYTDVGAGIVCRADESNNGDGYYFMINPNGYYSIQIGRGDGFIPLVDWQPSRAVRTGIDRNTIRAVCLDDQLSMYVNDQLVATTSDTTYQSGYAGLAVAAGNFSVDMTFDNVTLYSVEAPVYLASANLGSSGS